MLQPSSRRMAWYPCLVSFVFAAPTVSVFAVEVAVVVVDACISDVVDDFLAAWFLPRPRGKPLARERRLISRKVKPPPT